MHAYFVVYIISTLTLLHVHVNVITLTDLVLVSCSRILRPRLYYFITNRRDYRGWRILAIGLPMITSLDHRQQQ